MILTLEKQKNASGAFNVYDVVVNGKKVNESLGKKIAFASSNWCGDIHIEIDDKYLAVLLLQNHYGNPPIDECDARVISNTILNVERQLKDLKEKLKQLNIKI